MIRNEKLHEKQSQNELGWVRVIKTQIDMMGKLNGEEQATDGGNGGCGKLMV